MPAPASVPLPAPAAAGVGAPPRAPRRDRSPLPPVVRGLAAVGVAFLVLPLLALVVRAPWGDLVPLLTRPESLAALRLSLLTATSAAGLCVLVGVPLALVLARGTGRGLALVRALVVVPLVLPPVVGGVALLLAYGRRGLLGAPVDAATGWSLPFSTPAVIVAEAFVALPFLVIAVEAALRAADPRMAQVASTLGASRGVVLRRVTLPAVAPALVAGTVLCWARALGEFGATVTFAGSLPGTTRVLPTEVVVALETDPAAAAALSLLLLAVCVVVLVLLRARWLSPLVGGRP